MVIWHFRCLCLKYTDGSGWHPYSGVDNLDGDNHFEFNGGEFVRYTIAQDVIDRYREPSGFLTKNCGRNDNVLQGAPGSQETALADSEGSVAT